MHPITKLAFTPVFSSESTRGTVAIVRYNLNLQPQGPRRRAPWAVPTGRGAWGAAAGRPCMVTQSRGSTSVPPADDGMLPNHFLFYFRASGYTATAILIHTLTPYDIWAGPQCAGRRRRRGRGSGCAVHAAQVRAEGALRGGKRERRRAARRGSGGLAALGRLGRRRRLGRLGRRPAARRRGRLGRRGRWLGRAAQLVAPVERASSELAHGLPRVWAVGGVWADAREATPRHAGLARCREPARGRPLDPRPAAARRCGGVP